jgi:integrase
VQISPLARTCLERLRERAPADQVYITPEAKEGKPDRRTWFERAVKKAGLRPAFDARDLRYTFASRLAAAGVPLLTIQQLAGHKSFSTTLRYAHVAGDVRKKAVAEVRLYAREESGDPTREGAAA